jgi:hypothetical protein
MGELGEYRVAGLFFSFMENSKYIEEISKYCNPFSILVIVEESRLLRIHCPFTVITIQSIGNYTTGDIAHVQAVKITPDLMNVYIIEGKAYHFYFFRILL